MEEAPNNSMDITVLCLRSAVFKAIKATLGGAHSDDNLRLVIKYRSTFANEGLYPFKAKQYFLILLFSILKPLQISSSFLHQELSFTDFVLKNGLLFTSELYVII